MPRSKLGGTAPEELFREWLITQGKTKVTVKETVNYAKKYASVLDTRTTLQRL
jgi:hypothetical protein